MKLPRPYLLLAGAAVLGTVAAYIAISRTIAQPTDASIAAPSDGRRTARTAAVEAPPPAGNPLWAIPLTQLPLTRDRPIFSPSRRPPAPPPPVAVVPVAPRPPPKPREPERPAVTLVGTIASETEAIGVFMEAATRNVVRLRLGEEHQGWVLRSLKAREATLEKDSQSTVLELPPPGGEAAVAANSAPANEPPARPDRRPPRR